MKRGGKNRKIPGIGEIPHITTGLKCLAESGARYLIVGGVASNLHGLARATKDIDVLIPKELENTAKILEALEGLTWGLSKEISAEEVISKPFTIIGDLPRVDLLLRAGKIKFEDAYPNRMAKTIYGMEIFYVSKEDLIRSKETNRPRDKLEIEELKALKVNRKGKRGK